MSHKNVLLLVADDLGKYLGCYGCKSVDTPNLDKLAAKGSRFDLAFASTASCSGSRSTLYTGLHTHQNGQYGLQVESTHFQTFPWIDTNVKIFQSKGYLTGIIAKVHVGTPEVYPFDVRKETGKGDPRDVAWMADECDAFFTQSKDEDKPFFLTAAFHDPHRDTTRGGFGNNVGLDTLDKRIKHKNYDTSQVEVPVWLSDVPEVRQELAEYYQAINRMDQGVGMILENLEKQGLADDTLVVFVSDNGPPFINAKATLFDAGTCLPFIVHVPGQSPGIANPNMVSFIDVLPTAMEYCSIPLDYKLHPRSPARPGRSFLNIVESSEVLPESKWDQAVMCSHTYHQLEQYWPTRAIRTKKWKYHRNVAWKLDFPSPGDLYASLSYDGMRNNRVAGQAVMIGPRSLKDYLCRPAQQLFDLESDPAEVVDLANDPKYAEVIKDLRYKLEKFQEKTLDPWLFRDGHSIKSMRNITDNQDWLVPDRWDEDPENPGTREGVKMMKPRDPL